MENFWVLQVSHHMRYQSKSTYFFVKRKDTCLSTSCFRPQSFKIDKLKMFLFDHQMFDYQISLIDFSIFSSDVQILYIYKGLRLTFNWEHEHRPRGKSFFQ